MFGILTASGTDRFFREIRGIYRTAFLSYPLIEELGCFENPLCESGDSYGFWLFYHSVQ
uniref:Uncharacterized protein n=1 Tax=Anguilla anguilla TaxID=7936 RepID=A0A0E9V562_ANGAN